MSSFCVGDCVEVVSGCENDNIDDGLIGLFGKVVEICPDDYYEVVLENQDGQSHCFAAYQLAEATPL